MVVMKTKNKKLRTTKTIVRRIVRTRLGVTSQSQTGLDVRVSTTTVFPSRQPIVNTLYMHYFYTVQVCMATKRRGGEKSDQNSKGELNMKKYPNWKYTNSLKRLTIV